MRHLAYFLAIVTLSVTLQSCSPWTVKTDVDPDINFAELKTYTIARNTRNTRGAKAEQRQTLHQCSLGLRRAHARHRASSQWLPPSAPQHYAQNARLITNVWRARAIYIPPPPPPV